MKGEVLFVNRELQNQIETLRQLEYAKAKGFSVDLSTLGWKKSDDDSYILAAQIDSKIVSTMRGEVIDDIELLEKKLECPWSFPRQIRMPVLLLSRAATVSEMRGAGFNLLLRYHFLSFAKELKIPYVLGTFVAGSPRENTLKEMKYEFFSNSLGWQQSTYRSLAPVNVVLLDMEKNGDCALNYCESKIMEEIESFPMRETLYPALKIVRNL